MTFHHPVEASFRAEPQEIEPGQEEALDDLGPGVLLGSRATRAANRLCLRGAGLESLELADELPRVLSLEHKGIAAGDRIVLTRDPGARNTARGHGLKADQAKG